MGKDQPQLYRVLSRTPYPRSYVGKIFFTAFLGTHVPLLALLSTSCVAAASRWVARCAYFRSLCPPLW